VEGETVNGDDVFLHEGLECLTEAMNCLRRLKSEAPASSSYVVGFWA
jgi:hypothetical protein